MKRSILVLVVAGLVVLATGTWYLSSIGKFNPADLLNDGVVILLVGFASYAGVRRWGSARRGEPMEDEFSRKLVQRTAASSYYVSLFMWLFLMFLEDRLKMETGRIIGMGIMGMAVIFAIAWVVANVKGIRNE